MLLPGHRVHTEPVPPVTRSHVQPPPPSPPALTPSCGLPFLWFGIYCVPQGIVGIVFKSHPRSRVPLGMLLAKALLGIGAQSQLLALSQLDDEDVCGERRESVKGQGGMVGPPSFGLECHWKAIHIWKMGQRPAARETGSTRGCVTPLPPCWPAKGQVGLPRAHSLQPLTILFHVVIGVIISVPGCHLQEPKQRHLLAVHLPSHSSGHYLPALSIATYQPGMECLGMRG